MLTNGFFSKQLYRFHPSKTKTAVPKRFKMLGDLQIQPVGCYHPSYKVGDGPERGMIEHQGIPWIEPGENPPRLSF